MRTRQEIKAIGRERFLANYWPCVLVVLIMGLILAAISGVTSGPTYISAVSAAASGREPDISAASTGGSFLGSVAILLLSGPLTIGQNYFFIMNVLGRESEATLGAAFRAAFTNYGRKLGGSLWMALFIFLWTLLFFIPGIIKSFSYAMTPYILADCPNVKARDALKLSMRIMAGHKWELFVFELSFIGWALLSALTAGILDIFYVGPYVQSATATYYLEVREEALRNGVVTMAQLEGRQEV